VARAVLGMANRLPDRAGPVCEGLGYVVVGAEPNNLCGIDSVDPATFDEITESYVGGVEGPHWTPSYISVDGRNVLVVTVEQPRQGDPIFTLRKEYIGNRSGTVFVRKHGRTAPADANDLDALQARLLAGVPANADLKVSLTGHDPLPWLNSAAATDDVSAWMDAAQSRIIRTARDTERARTMTRAHDNLVEAALGTSGILGAPDDRTLVPSSTKCIPGPCR
jgi:hypothetical protein